jgi:hypothetical protein
MRKLITRIVLAALGTVTAGSGLRRQETQAAEAAMT